MRIVICMGCGRLRFNFKLFRCFRSNGSEVRLRKFRVFAQSDVQLMQ